MDLLTQTGTKRVERRRQERLRRLDQYKRPVTDPGGAVVGYLDRWGNPWIVRALDPNGGWAWREVRHVIPLD